MEKEPHEYYDDAPSEGYIKDTKRWQQHKEEMLTKEYFKGDKSSEFYMGMIAALRVLGSAIIDPRQTQDYLESLVADMNITATILLLEKLEK